MPRAEFSRLSRDGQLQFVNREDILQSIGCHLWFGSQIHYATTIGSELANEIQGIHNIRITGVTVLCAVLYLAREAEPGN